MNQCPLPPSTESTADVLRRQRIDRFRHTQGVRAVAVRIKPAALDVHAPEGSPYDALLRGSIAVAELAAQAGLTPAGKLHVDVTAGPEHDPDRAIRVVVRGAAAGLSDGDPTSWPVAAAVLQRAHAIAKSTPRTLHRILDPKRGGRRG